VKVKLAWQPKLQDVAGHDVHLFLEGTQIAQGQQTIFKLNNIDRGTHTLRAEVEDSNGNALISTTAARFTLQRYSRLF
jgi:hypothetical protein